jgi:aspartate kinase
MRVQKFGGTSMGSANSIRNHVVPRIIEAKQAEKEPVVVVSAMSGVTNDILRASEESLRNHLTIVSQIVEEIRRKHNEVIEMLIGDPKANAVQVNDKLFKRLNELLRGINLIDEITPLSQDKLIAIGEKLSANLLSNTLTDMGYPAAMIDLDNEDQRPLLTANGPETSRQLAKYIERKMGNANKEAIPVLTGFIGPVEGGLLKTIGRGYSDYCASLAAIAVKADLIENWTDVDGILSADPRVEPDATLLNSITYDEMAELAHNGAKVIHPFSVEPARIAGLDIHVKNTFNPDSKGTVISNHSAESHEKFKSITAKKGVSIMRIKTPKMLDSYGYIKQISEIFEKHKVSIDLISTSAVSVSITVDKKTESLFVLMDELRKFGEVNMVNGHSVISIVGNEIGSSIENINAITSALKEGKVPVKMISMGDSGLNINLVIEDEFLDSAIKALHKIR